MVQAGGTYRPVDAPAPPPLSRGLATTGAQAPVSDAQRRALVEEGARALEAGVVLRRLGAPPPPGLPPVVRPMRHPPPPVAPNPRPAFGVGVCTPDEIYQLAAEGAREVLAAARSTLNASRRSQVQVDQPMQAFPGAMDLGALRRHAERFPRVLPDLDAALRWVHRPAIRVGGPEVAVPHLRATRLSPQHWEAVKSILRRTDTKPLVPAPIRALARPNKDTCRLIMDARAVNAWLADPPVLSLLGIEHVSQLLYPGCGVIRGDYTSAFLQVRLGEDWDPWASPMPGWAMDRLTPGTKVAAFVMQAILLAFLAQWGTAAHGWYDDFLVVFESPRRAQDELPVVDALARKCRITLKREAKSGAGFLYLGVLFDSDAGTRSLPREKVVKTHAAIQVLAARAHHTPLEVMQAVGVCWHAAEVLRAPLLVRGLFRHVLSVVALHPMRVRLHRGLHALSQLPVQPALRTLYECLMRNRAPLRPPPAPAAPAHALVVACDAAVEPHTRTYLAAVELPPDDLPVVTACVPVPPGCRIAYAEARAVMLTLDLVRARPAGRRDVVIIEDNSVVTAALRYAFSRSVGVARVIREYIRLMGDLGARLWVVPVGTARQPGDWATRAFRAAGTRVAQPPRDWISRAEAIRVAEFVPF